MALVRVEPVDRLDQPLAGDLLEVLQGHTLAAVARGHRMRDPHVGHHYPVEQALALVDVGAGVRPRQQVVGELGAFRPTEPVIQGQDTIVH